MITDTKTAGVTERIARLKENILSVKSTICTERAKIYTKAYQVHEGTPVILKRAYALEKTLKEMSVFIQDGELIVGNQSSAVRAAPVFPEYVTSWIIKELDEFDKRPGDAFFVTERQKEELREICSWWEGRTLIERGYSLMSPLNKEIHDSGIIRAEGNLTSGDAHIAVNFEKILKHGLAGYLDEIEKAARSVKSSDEGYVQKQNFFSSLRIGIESFMAFIRRFEKLALELSEKEADRKKKGRTYPDKQKLQEHCGKSSFRFL